MNVKKHGTDAKLAFVIAHYHDEGRVPANLFNLVKHIRALTPAVVFVSTGLSSEEAARLSPYARVMVRENVGYDFWSYKLGIDELGNRSHLDRLVLLNSSFVTLDPRRLCEAFFTPLAGPALRGITCCAEKGWHAQSYWVAFETNSLINSDKFSKWWSTLVPISKRSAVIEQQEVGMSAWFAAHGVAVKPAFVPSAEDLLVAVCRSVGNRLVKIEVPDETSSRVIVDLDTARELNYTHFLWDSVLKHFHILKIDLLKTNPTLQNIYQFLGGLSRTQPALFDLILDAVPSLRTSQIPHGTA